MLNLSSIQDLNVVTSYVNTKLSVAIHSRNLPSVVQEGLIMIAKYGTPALIIEGGFIMN